MTFIFSSQTMQTDESRGRALPEIDGWDSKRLKRALGAEKFYRFLQ